MTEENVSLVRSYNDAMSFSREYAMTRYGDRADMAVRAAEALVKIQAGAELGFGPMASISAFHVINDKPTMSGIAWAAKVRLSGRYDYRIVKSNSTECELMFLDAGSDAYLSVFTLDDAKRAGLLGNNTWKKYPEDMLFNRAMTKGARKVCPEIGMGMGIYTPEELRGNEVDLYDEPPVKHQALTMAPPDEVEIAEIERTEDVERPAGLSPATSKPSATEALVAVLLEVNALADIEAIDKWAGSQQEGLGMAKRAASMVWAFVDGVSAMRKQELWEPQGQDSLLFDKACELASIAHVNPSRASVTS